MSPDRQHIVFLTKDELIALANFSRVAMKEFGENEYIAELKKNGGKSGFDKIVTRIKEINGDTDGK